MRKHILTITILLLCLSVHVSAQVRTPKEALAGLRDIGVIVKYDRADGLPEVMRPTILQMLQGRATDTLRLAEIPLLQSTDEAAMVGRPRLVFTVTATNQTATAPAIYVDTRVYQRVRLCRDPAKEMELATWIAGGVGTPNVTNKMLFDVFDVQVNWFVKDYRQANPKPLPVENGTPVSHGSIRDDTNSLQGFNGVGLFISFRSDPLSDAAHRAELQKILQSEAESKFQQVGIPVLRYINESEKAGSPVLSVVITVSGSKSRDPAIVVDSYFRQQVRLIRDPQKIIDAVTWESRASEGGPTTDEAVLRVVNSQLAEFIKAYTAANPKLKSAQ